MRLTLPTAPTLPREDDNGFPRGPDYLELESGIGRAAFHVAGQDAPPNDRLRAAFRDGRPEAFLALNEEFVPSWCPRCPAIYCADHWRTWLVFDPEHPIWLEETRGECPNGHERMLSD